MGQQESVTARMAVAIIPPFGGAPLTCELPQTAKRRRQRKTLLSHPKAGARLKRLHHLPPQGQHLDRQERQPGRLPSVLPQSELEERSDRVSLTPVEVHDEQDPTAFQRP